MVVLTKSDLCADVVAGVVAAAERAALGANVHAVSSVTGDNLDTLARYLEAGRTIALLGMSGTGKSTLINRLAGAPVSATGAVREGDHKGRHTTTHRQLISLPGGALLLDTPGLRELQLWEGAEGIRDTFADIETLAADCRFDDCRHDAEPGCAVRAAVAAGHLDEARLLSYHKLLREEAWFERRHDARLQAENTRRWKQIIKSLKHHPKKQR